MITFCHIATLQTCKRPALSTPTHTFIYTTPSYKNHLLHTPPVHTFTHSQPGPPGRWHWAATFCPRPLWQQPGPSLHSPWPCLAPPTPGSSVPAHGRAMCPLLMSSPWEPFAPSYRRGGGITINQTSSMKSIYIVIPGPYIWCVMYSACEIRLELTILLPSGTVPWRSIPDQYCPVHGSDHLAAAWKEMNAGSHLLWKLQMYSCRQTKLCLFSRASQWVKYGLLLVDNTFGKEGLVAWAKNIDVESYSGEILFRKGNQSCKHCWCMFPHPPAMIYHKDEPIGNLIGLFQ